MFSSVKEAFSNGVTGAYSKKHRAIRLGVLILMWLFAVALLVGTMFNAFLVVSFVTVLFLSISLIFMFSMVETYDRQDREYRDNPL